MYNIGILSIFDKRVKIEKVVDVYSFEIFCILVAINIDIVELKNPLKKEKIKNIYINIK
ncbi:hypothetical protein YN1HA_9260 [Sulfurisphaera ohwakuensis]